MRVSQDVGSLPQFLKAPQALPSLGKPPMLAPTGTSEAEQVVRLLTGQPLPAGVPIPNPLPSSSGANPATGVASKLTAAASTLASQASSIQAPRIVVTPSPVVVVSPPPTTPKKKQSRLHKMMNSIGNRFSEANPGR